MGNQALPTDVPKTNDSGTEGLKQLVRMGKLRRAAWTSAERRAIARRGVRGRRGALVVVRLKSPLVVSERLDVEAPLPVERIRQKMHPGLPVGGG